MHIKIISKGNGKKVGVLTSKRFESKCKMDIQYQKNKGFFIDLQKLLLKHFEVKMVAGEGKIRGKVWLPKIKETLETKNKHSHSIKIKEVKNGK